MYQPVVEPPVRTAVRRPAGRAVRPPPRLRSRTSGTSTAPWAMQLAVLDRRPDRPAHLAVCEAAAAAVVTLLADPRAQRRRVGAAGAPLVVGADPQGRAARAAASSGPPPTTSWRGPASRSRGAVPPCAAFVPVPIDTLGRELSTLQVGGTQMPELGEPAEAVPGGLTIALTPDVELSTGKAAAQSGHAAHIAWQSMPAGARDRWAATGWAVSVVLPDAAGWRRLAATWPVSIRDGGFTEVRPGTMTAVAGW